MRTSAHHTHVWVFPKLLSQSLKHTIVYDDFICCSIRNPSLLELRGQHMFYHGNAHGHNAGSMKIWFSKVGVEELNCHGEWAQIPTATVQNIAFPEEWRLL